jgi:hypothetical protein
MESVSITPVREEDILPSRQSWTATPDAFRFGGPYWEPALDEERVRQIVREELAALGLLPK